MPPVDPTSWPRHRPGYQPGCVSDPVVMAAQPVSGLLIAGDVDACLGAVTTYSLTPDVTALDVGMDDPASTAGVIRPGNVGRYSRYPMAEARSMP